MLSGEKFKRLLTGCNTSEYDDAHRAQFSLEDNHRDILERLRRLDLKHERTNSTTEAADDQKWYSEDVFQSSLTVHPTAAATYKASLRSAYTYKLRLFSKRLPNTSRKSTIKTKKIISEAVNDEKSYSAEEIRSSRTAQAMAD